MSNFSRLPAVLALVVLALLSPMAVLAQTDAEREREQLNEQQAELTEEIDVLEASNDEVTAALDDFDAAVRAQQADVDAAKTAVADAEAALAEAEANLEAARHDVGVLKGAIEEMAIASYIHPPVEDLVQSLTVADFSDALIARTYLDARAKRDADLLGLLREAEAAAETRAAESQQAAVAAHAAAEAAEAELADLHSEQNRQQQFAGDVQARIDDALAESAVLAEMDAELAAEIAAQQEPLIERLPPPPEPEAVPLSTDDRPSPPTSAVPSSTVPASTPSTTAPTTTTTTPPPPPDTSAPPLRTVYGITVHADIADDVEALVGAARSAGISLGGSGYRSSDGQIATRKANCGTSYYAIWEMPSGQCSPPTAPPGTSMHERGLAIDFTDGGALIRSRSDPAFTWLSNNAAAYGLYNLPSEPWHWSTNGR